MPTSRLLNELNALMKSSDITQSELAKQLGMAQAQLSRNLSGKVQMGIDTYERILDILKPEKVASVNLERLEAIGLLLTAPSGTLNNVLRILRRDAASPGQQGESTVG